MKNKIKVSSELIYLLANMLLSFSVAMMSAADLGLSMIAAPSFILSRKFDFLTFGQCEYLIQGVEFIIFCILVKKIKLTYFGAFATCIIYGAFLDLWRLVIPAFNPDITAPDSIPMPVRVLFFIIGLFLTAMAVAMHFKTYLYPQVCDFFVKYLSYHFNIDRTKFKKAFDFGCLVLSCILTFVFFVKFVGISWGTAIITVLNGTLIGFFDKALDKVFVFVPTFPKLKKALEV